MPPEHDASYNLAMLISHTISFVKIIMEKVILPGDIVVDATTGNGIDTLFLSQCVGPEGHVFGFDVQQQALDQTRKRLNIKNAPDNVTLLQVGHELMARMLPDEFHGQVMAVMFNLGYLPGSNENIVTCAATTCPAIDSALSVMKPGGVISIVMYTGHPGGQKEAVAVDKHCATLSPNLARVRRCTMHNHPAAQTHLLLIERR
ncbi:class I SAM-dependent methyltransferase [Desulfovibrio ferrophilus]|uniref:class I SAM-dependent methyltransferase n=1 Tax=Desulfovibrio ferrophilus TaxID=241368 RepID=UPI001E56A0C3|nr:class I SAM-dependent methyltransferase [Desulfovibrio ferrophilus]